MCLYMKKLFLNDGNSIGQTDSAYQMPLREVVPVDLQMLTYTQVLRKLYADTLAVVHSKAENSGTSKDVWNLHNKSTKTG